MVTDVQDHFTEVFGTKRGAERTYSSHAFLDSLDFKDPSKNSFSPTFSPTRWPYTYAYDYVRSHSPEEMSRGDVATRLRSYVDGDEAAKERICIELATAYCAEDGIDVPAEFLLH